ncbi:ankyrin repeat and SOCS box protein 6 isoform X2 [Heliangelus exortis]|uniref:ankyrin repeat and SOCS box protein 6 isoform X2 n=1 Tax=Heliangelus exortis TaxID=472823 RepID=UPI003A9326F9
MPFLHGFRRITLEYQPLVDEILGLLLGQEGEQHNSCPGDRNQLSAVRGVLERETHSPFYQEGVSYALLKVTELGLLPAAEILLEFGADLSFEGKTALLHALASSDGVQIHNTESIRLLLEGGADVRATTEDGDTVFTYVIFLLGEMVCSSTEEVQAINHFCFRVTQLLVAHGANPSECPAPESLTYLCFQSFKCHFSLLRFLLESGAAYNCSLHGPSCWSGFHVVFECLCSDLSISEDDNCSTELVQKGQTLLELMMASSQAIQLPTNFEVNTSVCKYHGEKIRTLFCSLKQLERSPQTLKHLCRVFIRQHLKPWPVDVKIKALPLPDRLKWYLLIDHAAATHEDL